MIREKPRTKRKILEFVRDHYAATRTGTTVREVMAHLGYTSSTYTQSLIEELADAGLLSKADGHKARTILPMVDRHGDLLLLRRVERKAGLR